VVHKGALGVLEVNPGERNFFEKPGRSLGEFVGWSDTRLDDPMGFCFRFGWQDTEKCAIFS